MCAYCRILFKGNRLLDLACFSLKSSVCALWMMCSVSADLTGKHEVREDVK